MGQPKAWLPFGPERMLQRVVRLVSTVVEDVVVVAAPGQDLPPLPASICIARDEIQGRGPLQGLLAGLSTLPESVELAYATATDVPFLEPGWIMRLVELIGEHDLAMPWCDGYHHPLAALYRRATVLPAVDALLRSGRFRPVFLMESLSTRLVAVDQLTEVDPQLETLRNLNNPEDYLAALRQAGYEEAEGRRVDERTDPPSVVVEFYGVPRLRAGLPSLKVKAMNLGDALGELGRACPLLLGTILNGRNLLPEYAANLNGDRFVSDPATPLHEGDSLILLSIDVGG
jgi:molybdopterin-guanine dinucleotide biosynthesis protein A